MRPSRIMIDCCWLGILGTLLQCIALHSASETQCGCSGLQITRVDKTSGKCICWECPDCNEGMGSSVPCASVVSIEVSIQCVFCKNHFTFSDGPGKGQCRPCSVCHEHELVVRECSYNNDIQCGDCEDGFYRNKITDDCLPTSSEVSIASSVVPSSTPSSMRSFLHATPSMGSTLHQNTEQLTALTAVQVTSSVIISTSATASSSTVASIETGQLQESNVVNIKIGVGSGVGALLGITAAVLTLCCIYKHHTGSWPQFLTRGSDSRSVSYDCARDQTLVICREGGSGLQSGNRGVSDPLLEWHQSRDISSLDLPMDETTSTSSISMNDSEATYEGSFHPDIHDEHDQTRETVLDVSSHNRNSIQPDEQAAVDHDALSVSLDNESRLQHEGGEEQPQRLRFPPRDQSTSTTGLYVPTTAWVNVPQEFRKCLMDRKVRDIPLEFYSRICNCLDVFRAAFWDDYRLLGEKVGLSKDACDKLGQNKNPTDAIIQKFDSKENSSIRKFQELLEEMERFDAVEVIEQWIQKKWQEEQVIP